MSGKRERPVLVDQQVALSAYLDALLREVPIESEVKSEKPAPVRLLRNQEQIQGEEVALPVETVAPIAVKSPYPDWVEASFQCLLFSVRGLTLAVPLEKLCGIVEWNDSVTKLPERPPWFLGVMTYRERQSGIIDTAGVVMPERLDNASARTSYAHIIFFDDGRWGLACERVDQVITLTKDEVRWRTSRTKRPWLAGTVVDHMCALLDVEALAEMIKAA